MSRGPWVWVRPGGWGPRGLPGATPAQLCPCPESTFRVAAGWWPCTGPGRAAAQIVLVPSALAEVPVPAGRVRGARAKGRGERHNQQTQMCYLHFWRRDRLLYGPCLSTDKLRKTVFCIPIGNLEWLYINIFIFTASCQVKVIFPYATSWLDVNGKFCPSTCQHWKTFKMYE